MGPFPKAMQFAWHFTRLDSAHNHGLTLDSRAEEWGRLGPLAAETLADVRNIKERSSDNGEEVRRRRRQWEPKKTTARKSIPRLLWRKS